MESKIDWIKAPVDAEYWCEMQFFKTVNGEWKVWCPGLGSWVNPAYKAPDNFSWWGNAVARPTTPSWSGEGLPPVGVVCMANGYQVVIVAHHCNGIHAIYAESESGGLLYYGEPNEFRPIRTPEKIAADERERMANMLWQRYLQPILAPAQEAQVKTALGLIYDDFYRKP